MDCGQTAVVAGVHSLKHVDRFATADLADHDAIGPHAKGVANQVSLRNFAAAFNVRRTRFEPDDVRLLQLQFGRVFDSDDAFVLGNESGKRIEQRSFTGARSA